MPGGGDTVRRSETDRVRRKVGGILAFCGWLLAAALLGGCASSAPALPEIPGGAAAERCLYLDTIALNGDMGTFQIHPQVSDRPRREVLRRAQMIEATHVEWLADFPFGVAALAWRCEE